MIKPPCWIELERAAFQKNIRYLKRRIGSARFCSVIKGNAYGHGISSFLPLAEGCGVSYFAVFDSFEARRAWEVKKPTTELMIMGYIANGDLAWAIGEGISFYVFDVERLRNAVEASRKVGKAARIHVELETGMRRTGFEEEELQEVIKIILNHPVEIKVEGICTHYAGAENIANYVRVNEQYEMFNKLSERLRARNIQARYYHTASSAAALTYPHTIMDLVRMGIAQYGFWPSKETKMYNMLSDDARFTVNPLRRGLSWKSRVMSLKWVGPGKFVSYGTSFMTGKSTRLASIPVGYSHGFSRSLSNLGHVLIRGKKASVIGFVNMSMFLVDVTHIKEIQKGDEVVLIGKQGKQTITVDSFSEMASHVNYELLTRLSPDIPRIIRG